MEIFITTVAVEISGDLARETRTDRTVSQAGEAAAAMRVTRERRSC
jgi:hypothetical protein